MANRLIFQETPEVVFGSNRFVGVPVILEYAGTPLVEVVQDVKNHYTTSLPIYDKDRNYIAKLVGTRLVPGPQWSRSRLTMRHPRGGDHICALDGRPIIELRRNGAAATSLFGN